MGFFGSKKKTVETSTVPQKTGVISPSVATDASRSRYVQPSLDKIPFDLSENQVPGTPGNRCP
eukprot:4303067-Ditylum_brightwellii.AAC.2